MPLPILAALKAFSIIKFFKNMDYKKIFIIGGALVLIIAISFLYVRIQSLKHNISKLEQTITEQDLQIKGLKIENRVLEQNKKKVEESLDIVNKTIKKMQEEDKKYQEKVIVNKKVIKEYIKVKDSCEETPEKKKANKKIRNFILNKFKDLQ